MKNLLYLFLFLAFPIFLAAQTDKDFAELIANEKHSHEHMLTARSNELTEDYDVKYHRMQWNIDPNIFYISGSVTTYFEANEMDFQQVNFDLSTALTVDSVIYHGESLSFVHMGTHNLQIDLPAPLETGVLDSIAVYYQGDPPTTGFGSFNQATHNGSPVIWSLSEPYGARDWWPCKQDLNDKIDSIDIWVTTPSEFRVAANGLLEHEIEDGDNKIYHWKHRYPIPAYLIAIGVTNYAVYSDYVQIDNGEIEVLNYVYPENLAFAQSQTYATVEAMELFNELFGLYPFADEKYGHAQFSWGGGMEHQTMSFMGGWSYGLQAHELAHQWFGDKVTCGSWEDIWLNEGFATYLDGLTYEHGLRSLSFQDWLQGKIDHVMSQADGSVWVPDTTNVGRIFSGRLSYSKGALVLHMLRWKLGDEDFFQGIQNYLADPELAFGYARTEDLKYHLEAQSGQDLTEFLNDWFYGEGYPEYSIQWWQDPDFTVHFILNQTTSHSSVDFFEMPVPIQLIGGGEEDIFRLENTYSGQHLTVNPGYNVSFIKFDPDLWLVATAETELTGTSEQELLNQSVTLSPNPTSGIVTLHSDLDLANANFRLTDAKGAIQDFVELENAGSGTTLSFENLPAGIYFLEIQTEQGVVFKKVTKN